MMEQLAGLLGSASFVGGLVARAMTRSPGGRGPA
jgi:hypothetical protein